ncbi:MAG: hypothetical protein ACTSWN_07075 [Promethearchaeota archaeon]
MHSKTPRRIALFTCFKSTAFSLALFIVVLGIGYICGKYFSKVVFIGFVLSETGMHGIFSIKLGELAQYFAWSYFLPLLGLYWYENSVAGLKKLNLLSEKKETATFYFVILALILISTGNMLHILFNRLNGMFVALDLIEGELWPTFVLIYFLDEFLSHGMIYIGITMLVTIVFSLKPSSTRLLRNIRHQRGKAAFISNIVLASVMGVIQALSSLEGQSALLLMVVSGIIISFTLFYYYKKNNQSFHSIGWDKRPIFIFFIVLTVAHSCTCLIWAIKFGLLPAYPFLRQPHEVLL